MRVFDLEAAKAGAPVCTISGNPVRIICFDKKGTCSPIIGLIECGTVEKLNRYDGEGYDYHGIGNNNLMMRDDDYAEKLARGEYGPTVKEKLTVDNPTCKDSLPADREYWRRVYAGQIMPVVFHAAITTGAKVKDEYKDMPADVAVARSAIILADVLLAELEKK